MLSAAPTQLVLHFSEAARLTALAIARAGEPARKLPLPDNARGADRRAAATAVAGPVRRELARRRCRWPRGAGSDSFHAAMMIDGTWLVLRAAGLVLALQAAGIAIFVRGLRPRPEQRARGGRDGRRTLRPGRTRRALRPAVIRAVYLAGDWPHWRSACKRLALASPAGAALSRGLGGALCVALGLHASACRHGAIWRWRCHGDRRFLCTHRTHRRPRVVAAGSHRCCSCTFPSSPSGSARSGRCTWCCASSPPRRLPPCSHASRSLAVWLVPLIAVGRHRHGAAAAAGCRRAAPPYGLVLLAKAACSRCSWRWRP